MNILDLKNIFPQMQVGKKVNLPILGIQRSNKDFKANYAFVAVKGANWDGHSFVEQACALGASFILLEDAAYIPKNADVSYYVSANIRKDIAKLSAYFYSEPSKKLKCIGITGTNGKTTTTYLIEHILNQQNLACGIIGTTGHRLLQNFWPSEMTSPDSLVLQERLQQMLQASAKAVAMEVSSHAIHQYRADAVDFDVCIFSNLTQDHLDYHKTMDEYFAAKQRLFHELLNQSNKKNKAAIINFDDPWQKNIEAKDYKVLTYGSFGADLSFHDVKYYFSHTEAKLFFSGQEVQLRLPMAGIHNLYNAMSAILACCALGIDFKIAVNALSNFKGVSGRLEFIENQQNKNIFVDYAHTDDALLNTLGFLHNIRMQTSPGSKIYCLFGAGGDRDKAKRPKMMKAALLFSDAVILTSDNPRSEDPIQIIKDIMSGCNSQDRQKVICQNADRKEAITFAMRTMQEGDVLLIAGKGHEDYQEIQGKRYPFSDQKVVQQLLGEIK